MQRKQIVESFLGLAVRSSLTVIGEQMPMCDFMAVDAADISKLAETLHSNLRGIYIKNFPATRYNNMISRI